MHTVTGCLTATGISAAGCFLAAAAFAEKGIDVYRPSFSMDRRIVCAWRDQRDL